MSDESTPVQTQEERIKELEDKVQKLETMLSEWQTYKNSAFYQQAARVQSEAQLRPQRRN